MSRQSRSASAVPGASPLIETKLLPPRGRPELVARPRLLRTLDTLSPAALTLVDAPVGFGKTVLAQSWGAHADTSVAWVSIDAADDDPVRLWTYVAAAVDRIRSGLGRGALSRLRAGEASPEAAVDELVNGIAAYGQPLAVVLDDLHMLRSDACLRSFERAVERLPAHARIVATTRSDPAIALGRLRARGDLGEIRAGELAFTIDEARELVVGQERIALTDGDVAMLVDRTEGWPAGLYLAALWLRTLDDPSAGVRDFHGDHRHVADYLTGEVLDTLEPETREFLLRTSILGRFNGALCDAVLARSGSARLIADLASSNLFLIGLDSRGEWFRYHHLFGELLQLELGLVDPAAANLLHLRASIWCRDHGLIEEALEHAHAGGDDELVATMLVERHAHLMRTGRQATLLRWLGELPPARILESPILAAAGALASSLLGREAEERRRFLALANRAREERTADWTPYLEAGVGLARAISVDDDVGAAVASARVTAEVGRDVDEIAVPALANLGFLLFLSGAHEEARLAALEAVNRPEAPARPNGYVYALATLALIEAEADVSHEAESKARQALAVSSAAGIAETGAGGLARLALAAALSVSGRLADAEREAVHGERLRRQSERDASHLYALLVLADIRAQRGHLSRAADDLERARTVLDGFRDAGGLKDFAARVERRIDDARLVNGPLEEAPSAAELSVLRLLAGDLSQREIGSELFLSVNTVKTHTRSLYRKLGATSREAAVARATALGLLDGHESPG